MSRTVEEWIGATDDQAIPARVKIRIFDRCGGRCVTCTLRCGGSLRPTYDHIQALVNGGEHRERNLQLLCVPCHAVKTKADVAEKSRNYRKRAKHIGVTAAKRPMPGSLASGLRKRMNGTVERR